MSTVEGVDMWRPAEIGQCSDVLGVGSKVVIIAQAGF